MFSSHSLIYNTCLIVTWFGSSGQVETKYSTKDACTGIFFVCSFECRKIANTLVCLLDNIQILSSISISSALVRVNIIKIYISCLFIFPFILFSGYLFPRRELTALALTKKIRNGFEIKMFCRWHILKETFTFTFDYGLIGRLGVIPPIHPFRLQALLKKVFKRFLRDEKNYNNFFGLIMDW